MKVGKPRRVYRVEPLVSPVPEPKPVRRTATPAEQTPGPQPVKPRPADPVR
jgi:hypothetical protein